MIHIVKNIMKGGNMTQEDKDLLLKDLCARLPYGVKCRYHHIQDIINARIIGINLFGIVNVDGHIKDVCDVKPYLFPLSSMTEEQTKEFLSVAEYEPREEDCGRLIKKRFKNIIWQQRNL